MGNDSTKHTIKLACRRHLDGCHCPPNCLEIIYLGLVYKYFFLYKVNDSKCIYIHYLSKKIVFKKKKKRKKTLYCILQIWFCCFSVPNQCSQVCFFYMSSDNISTKSYLTKPNTWWCLVTWPLYWISTTKNPWLVSFFFP